MRRDARGHKYRGLHFDLGTDVEHVAQDAGRDSTLRVMSEGDFNLPSGGKCPSTMAVKQQENSTNKEAHIIQIILQTPLKPLFGIPRLTFEIVRLTFRIVRLTFLIGRLTFLIIRLGTEN